MMQHTPGPWAFTDRLEFGPISDADDQTYGMVLPIGDVFGENKKADLALVTAAPDMHEALKDALWAIDNMAAILTAHGLTGTPTDPTPVIRAALEKAKPSN